MSGHVVTAKGESGDTGSGVIHAAAASVLLGVALVTFCRTAWLCDDAFITLRTVDNLVHGYGLRWNVGERVQAYTHPLWLGVLAAGRLASGEVYYTSILVSIALSLGALIIFARHLGHRTAALAFGVVAFVGSRAFVDYSTSGLENPLSHLLLAIVIGGCLASGSTRHPLAICTAAGLLLVNRLDLAVLILPLSLAYLATARHRITLWAAWLLPLVAWEVFSLIYYGFLFPNTAYAKLNTSLPERELLAQGLFYLRNSVRTDPVTIAVIACALGVAIGQRRRYDLSLAAGILAYVGFVVWIGGDFMSGRFLAAPFFASVLLLTLPRRLPREILPGLTAAALTLALSALGHPSPAYASGRHYGAGDRMFDASLEDHGINDERRFYFQHTGLLRQGRRAPVDHPWAQDALEVRQKGTTAVVRGNVGFFGYFAGPGVTVIDYYALTDPLLARLPSKRKWRIGHFARIMPDDYPATVRTGANHLVDPDLAGFYSDLQVITRGPVWRLGRFRLIGRAMLGRDRARPAAYAGRLRRSGYQ